MKKPLRLACLLSSIAFAAGCGNARQSTFTDDMSVNGTKDMPAASDMAGADLAGADLAGSDLSGGGDMAEPNDLASTDDLTVALDMTSPIDLISPIVDLPAVADRFINLDGGTPDIATIPDLTSTPMPDLTGSHPDLAGTPDMTSTDDGGGMGQLPSVVVLQVNDGKAAASSASTPGFLRRFQIDGTEVMGGGWPVTLPIAANGNNHPITFSGTATSEGGVSRSADGHYLSLGGYDSAPGTATIASTMTANVNRVIARVDAMGNVDTTTRFNATSFDGSNIRSVATLDGTAFWAAGTSSNAAAGGIQYIPFGMAAAGVQVLATPNNTRVAHVYPVNSMTNQLFVTSGSANYTTVLAVGSGTPTMAGQMANIGAGLTTTGASPYSFAILDRNPNVADLDTLYLADDSSIAKGGGIQKWTYDGMKWTLATTFQMGITTGVRGLTAFTNGNNVIVAVTTAEAAPTPNTLGILVDDGMNVTVKIIVTALKDTQLRGVALAPM